MDAKGLKEKIQSSSSAFPLNSHSEFVPGAGLEPNFKTEDFHNMLEVIEVVKPYLDL